MEPVPPSDRLAAVLAAASAPPQPYELTGEETALAAFRARPARRRFWLRRAVGIKLTVLFAVTLAAGGVAVANILPTPFDAPIVLPAPPVISPSRPQPEPPKRSEVTASPTPRPRATAAGAHGHAALCRQFAAKSGEERRRALRTPEFAPLVAIAGDDPEDVSEFCEELEEHPSPRPSRSRDDDDDDDDDD